MNYVYSQSNGEMRLDDGTLVGSGWAGRGAGKNDPDKEDVVRTGPLPRGWYTRGKLQDHPRLGKFVMELQPDLENDMHGRDDFWIHGASQKNYGQESMGCIIMPRPVRLKIAEGPDRLQVVR
jgi:hypothetical protein